MKLSFNINTSKLTPIIEMKGSNKKEDLQLNEMLQEASEYLLSFTWCKEIIKTFFGIGVPGIFAVFLFNIKLDVNVDDWLWVIVGDIPPAYITVDESPNPASALDGYLGAMYEWVNAVKEGRDTSGLIPVNVPPTIEMAALLEKRLQFLDDEILCQYAKDLKK